MLQFSDSCLIKRVLRGKIEIHFYYSTRYIMYAANIAGFIHRARAA